VAAGVGEVVSGDANLIKPDGLIDLQYSLHSSYARQARFALNRKTLRDIRKLKDGQGNYLWAPGYANAVPNSILGAPYVEFPDLPDVAAGAYPILWGDFKEAYTIVDRVGLGFLVDFLTMAKKGLVIYRGRKRVGGGVKEPNALKKLKIAAS
jgi:HK97 family phage major capsid protein